MSRTRREIRLETQDRWPNLYQFLAGYLHQDWPELSGSPEAAIDNAIRDHDISRLKCVLEEWKIWNASKGAEFDPRPAVNDGLGVEIWFEEPHEAREFMNMVYEKVIVCIRKTEKGWKP